MTGAAELVVALAAAALLREPDRGSARPTPVRFVEGIVLFWRDRALSAAAAASAASAFIGSGSLAFATLFLMRVKGMTPAQVGTWFAALLGVCVCAGIYASGRLIDRRVRRSPAAYGDVPAFATAVSLPFFVGFVFAPHWPDGRSAALRNVLPRFATEAAAANARAMVAEARRRTASPAFSSILFGDPDRISEVMLDAHAQGTAAMKAGPGDFPASVPCLCSRSTASARPMSPRRWSARSTAAGSRPRARRLRRRTDLLAPSLRQERIDEAAGGRGADRGRLRIFPRRGRRHDPLRARAYRCADLPDRDGDRDR